MLDKLVDIALIVGEQDERLEMLGIGSAIMANPVQRIVDPFGGEQGQRRGFLALEDLAAVDNLVVGLDQIGRVEIIGQLFLLGPVETGTGVLQRKGERDRRVGQLDPDFRGEGGGDPLQLVEQIGPVQLRFGDRRAIGVDVGEMAGCQMAGLGRLVGGNFDADLRIEPLLAVIAGQLGGRIAAEAGGRDLDLLGVEFFKQRHRLGGAVACRGFGCHVVSVTVSALYRKMLPKGKTNYGTARENGLPPRTRPA